MRISDCSSDVCSSDLCIGDGGALLQPGRAAIGHLAQQRGAQTGVDRAFENAELIVEILLDATHFLLLDLARTLVLLDAVAGEYLDIADGAIPARRPALRAALPVGKPGAPRVGTSVGG